MHTPARIALALSLVAAGVVLVEQAAAADVITVTTALDGEPGSLRQAVAAAADGDEIELAPGIDPELTLGEIVVGGKALTIRGQGADLTTIDALDRSRLFRVASDGALVLEDVALARGHAPNGVDREGSSLSGQHGGAILNAGATTLRRVIVRDSRAGDGVRTRPDKGGGASGSGGSGGAIRSTGTLTIEDSTLVGNHAGDAPSMGQNGIGGDGGAVSAQGLSVVIRRSTIEGNRAGNTAGTGLAINGKRGGRGGGLTGSGALTLVESTVRGNRAGDGGASTHGDAGDGGDGGGIDWASGTVLLDRSAVVENQAGYGGRGAWYLAPGSHGEGGDGGGLFLRNGTTTTIRTSTLSGNATGSGVEAPVPGGDGGGVANQGKLRIESSTIYGNEARAYPGQTQGKGGGLRNLGTGSVTLVGTILAANRAGSASNCAADLPPKSEGWNLLAPGTSCTTWKSTDVLAAPAMLPLADNGGLTPTHLPRPESPAVDRRPAGSSFPCEGTDQRGVARPQGDACDTGAAERDAPVTTSTTEPPTSTTEPPTSTTEPPTSTTEPPTSTTEPTTSTTEPTTTTTEPPAPRCFWLWILWWPIPLCF